MHTYQITCNTLLHLNRLIRSWRRRRPFRDCSKCIGGSENCPGITVAATRRYYKPQAMAMNCILRLSKAGAVPDHRKAISDMCIYIYVYILIIRIYIYYIYIYIYPQNRCLAVAKTVICHVRILLLVRAKGVFFFFKCKKMHFDLRPPMNLSTSILHGRRSVF